MTVKLPHWLRAGGVVIAALAIAIAAMGSGIADTLERALDPVRFAAIRHDASGRVVIVEMDAASTAAIKSWPWPRQHYAQVLDNLRRAGAANIVFDVDLSSTATPDGDAMLAQALARLEGLAVLPTFSQQANSGNSRSIDSLPLPQFREHVSLASVSIAPDDDGMVRKAPLGTVTAGLPRPSLSAYIAGRAGSADVSFPIDYSTRPQTIPRFSFVAVRDGKFDPARVRGRAILIGATAIEMGDRYATPAWGVLPGVVIQALATETLFAGIPVSGSGWSGLVLAAVFALAIARCRRVRTIVVVTIGAITLLSALAIATQTMWLRIYPLAPGLILLTMAAALRMLLLNLYRFHKQRTVDEQTGLPNRRALVTGYVPVRSCHLAVANLTNLDNATVVLGQSAVADIMLRTAERLRLIARDARVFRVGNRYLAAILDGVDDLDEAMHGLKAILAQPVEVSGRKVDMAITMGVAALDDADVDSALTKAMLGAETAYSNNQFWSGADTDIDHLDQAISLMGELDDAIVNGDISVRYQPKLDLKTNAISSVEALVRWKHPLRGHIGPDRFIPLAEQTGRIAPLTLFVLERTMRDLAVWRAAGYDVTAAVNISATLVASRAFNVEVMALLNKAIVEPRSLTFEITESATLADPQAAIAALERFRTLGIAISMDDYGTGQSTLSYLRTLPLAELKIDRSFVENAHRNRNDALMVRSTIDLAHDLGLKVVAEGIEEPECLDFLRSAGCDMAQGYLISRPVPADNLREFLDARRYTAAA